MIFSNNLQEFIASVMLPFALVAGGVLLAGLMVVVLAATLTNLLTD